MLLYVVAALFAVALCFKPEEEYKVTLVIYSGVPDPVWTVDPRHKTFGEIKSDLQFAITTGKTYRLKYMPATLGYKGFLVNAPDAKEAELIVGQDTKELQKLLLQTMPKGLIPDSLLPKIKQGIESVRVSQQAKEALPQKVLQAPVPGGIQHYAPRLDLRRWNDVDVVREQNNCYNYANDKITNSFAQPGTGSGHPYRNITADEIVKASESDGLLKMEVTPSDPVPAAPEQPNCLVALVVDKGVDFHCYRLDDNGLWSQKPGRGNATNLDGKGNLIHDPRDAVNLPYGPDYQFVSFMQIFTNIIDGPFGPR